MQRPTADIPPTLVVLDPSAASRLAAGGAEAWRSLLDPGVNPLGFYLAGGEAAQREDLASAIRRSPFWDRLCFCGPGEAVTPLLDGAATRDEALAACDRAEGRKQSLQLDPAALHFDERLLYYLYLRDPAELVPVPDRQARTLYRHPVAEALAERPEDVDTWLATLTRRRLLEPATLHDRTRHCRQCGSAHLQFVDVCPHCSSLQIRKAASLHCFTCGFVAPEADFHDERGLACPKCNARLRHIGVDYDRPLTQYACAHCHHAFVEARVLARCLDCRTEADPAELDVREVSSLRLSASGRAALRSGQIQESFAALDIGNHVAPAHFRHMIEWALAAQARHEMPFGLMLIEFLNAEQLVEVHGAPRAFLLLDEFARRLHELLRQSDITTRSTEERLWLFLPFSSAGGLAARLDRMLAEQKPASGPEMQLRVRYLQAPEQLEPQDNAEQMMSRLERLPHPQEA
ncbi:diguanylate cyclase domain-containing protein [Caldimonas brevitalea]|uniref:GGDEF domain-containing protein n=1 Tax=Caldimonas brevitalea TaxID=413882 RepID=A0A0G3BWS4_9BURK|nr:diguanylate cyclase [Caldimonas brevitalea]AKJ31811.1 hypothetical protein AAW51_5120 [Caldimonas brevitalea]